MDQVSSSDSRPRNKQQAIPLIHQHSKAHQKKHHTDAPQAHQTSKKHHQTSQPQPQPQPRPCAIPSVSSEKAVALELRFQRLLPSLGRQIRGVGLGKIQDQGLGDAAHAVLQELRLESQFQTEYAIAIHVYVYIYKY